MQPRLRRQRNLSLLPQCSEQRIHTTALACSVPASRGGGGCHQRARPRSHQCAAEGVRGCALHRTACAGRRRHAVVAVITGAAAAVAAAAAAVAMGSKAERSACSATAITRAVQQRMQQLINSFCFTLDIKRRKQRATILYLSVSTHGLRAATAGLPHRRRVRLGLRRVNHGPDFHRHRALGRSETPFVCRCAAVAVGRDGHRRRPVDRHAVSTSLRCGGGTVRQLQGER